MPNTVGRRERAFIAHILGRSQSEPQAMTRPETPGGVAAGACGDVMVDAPEEESPAAALPARCFRRGGAGVSDLYYQCEVVVAGGPAGRRKSGDTIDVRWVRQVKVLA